MEGQKKFAWLRSCRLGTLLGLLLAGGLLLYGLCLFLSYRAADIFNIVVEHRRLFPGTVTVGRLTATPLGRVEFEKLVWVSPEGVLLADIPRGEFQVKPLDIITQHVGSRSVTHLKVEGAYLHLIFDENMQLTGFRPPDKAPEEKKKREPGLGIVGLKSERPFKCLVEFKGGTIEAEAPGNKKTSPRRHFTIGHADLRAEVDTRGKTQLNLTAGQFTGTVDAGAFYLTGNLDFAPEVPAYDLYMKLRECNFNSLDVGMKLDDLASVEGRLTGELPRPIFDGTLTFAELHIPALEFTEVTGECHYEAGRFTARQVGAKIFGGTVEAKGYFDLEEKAWGMELHGEGLKGGAAAHSNSLKCRVELNLTMEENKARKLRHLAGDFHSGPGSYRMVPFSGISGKFERRDKTITFRDVVISMAAGDIVTDAFSIEKGKLTLGPIYLQEGEERLRVR